jgi:hypothetical protein
VSCQESLEEEIWSNGCDIHSGKCKDNEKNGSSVR